VKNVFARCLCASEVGTLSRCYIVMFYSCDSHSPNKSNIADILERHEGPVPASKMPASRNSHLSFLWMLGDRPRLRYAFKRRKPSVRSKERVRGDIYQRRPAREG
jgi:hypothetical protein